MKLRDVEFVFDQVPVKWIEDVAIETGEPDPRIVVTLVRGCDSDGFLARKLKDGTLVGEDLIATAEGLDGFRFKVTRAERTISTKRPQEAVWRFWS